MSDWSPPLLALSLLVGAHAPYTVVRARHSGASVTWHATGDAGVGGDGDADGNWTKTTAAVVGGNGRTAAGPRRSQGSGHSRGRVPDGTTSTGFGERRTRSRLTLPRAG
jgi:hypothetical protein